MSVKRITLVRPPFSHLYGVYGKLPRNHEIRPPLGLLYVASSLEKAGHRVSVIDAEASRMSPDRLYEEIVRREADFVGFTSTTPEFQTVAALCEKLKTSHPALTTVVGGAHVTALPNDTRAENPAIDYVVCGEGERAMVEIVDRMPAERIIRREDCGQLDELPAPARHLLNYDHYQYAMPGKGMIRMDAIESSRGCPFLCTFCFNRARKTRYRSPVLVVDEIEKTYREHRIQAMMFFDDTLTVSKKHLMALCSEIIRRGLQRHIVFYANTRANTTDREMLVRMKEAGVTEISMGVETGNPELLKQAKKGTTHDQYLTVYRWLTELKFQTRASFIVGLPYETHATVRDTIDFAKKLDLMRANCNILTPYPGTEIFQQALEGKGIHLVCRDWKEFKRWGTSVIRTDELSKEDLEYYQKRFLTEFYSQPKVIRYHVAQLLKGNFSYFYYRPVLFALRMRLYQDIFHLHAQPPPQSSPEHVSTGSR